ncbi:hypothetical protein [Geothrix sp. PMB-07]|nr:hypothetical protein [Geothrix sp. PMB-07]WLT32471.1 hypothetical protein Q9293_03880 [Geothrix sp. PMB-07]
MTTHAPLPIRRFAVGHPYALEWTVLAAATLTALVLWLRNS